MGSPCVGHCVPTGHRTTRKGSATAGLRCERGLAFKSCFSFSSQAAPGSSSGTFVLLCPVELARTKDVAGDYLVTCLRAVSASPFKTDHGEEQFPLLFPRPHCVILEALCGGSRLACPLLLLGRRGLPRPRRAEPTEGRLQLAAP